MCMYPCNEVIVIYRAVVSSVQSAHVPRGVWVCKYFTKYSVYYSAVRVQSHLLSRVQIIKCTMTNVHERSRINKKKYDSLTKTKSNI